MPGNIIKINDSKELQFYVGDSRMDELLDTLNSLGFRGKFVNGSFQPAEEVAEKNIKDYSFSESIDYLRKSLKSNLIGETYDYYSDVLDHILDFEGKQICGNCEIEMDNIGGNDCGQGCKYKYECKKCGIQKEIIVGYEDDDTLSIDICESKCDNPNEDLR